MRKWFMAVSIVAMGSASWADPVMVSGHHDHQVILGQGRDFVIDGHHLDVVITGRSARVTISGSHNDVVLDEPTCIDASGSHNDIVYRRGKPEILRTGSYNEVVGGDTTTPAIP